MSPLNRLPQQATPRYNNSIVEDMHFLSNLELMHSALKARAARSAAQRAWMPCDIQHGRIGVAIHRAFMRTHSVDRRRRCADSNSA
jgi:hypothetical protein